MVNTQLNIIYDNRMIDRFEPLIKEMIDQGIDFKLWDIVEDKNSVVRSINLSHKQIVLYAKIKGLKEVCIAEDDLMFTGKGAWQYFLKNKPEDYDIYLASTYIPPISNNIICGFHLYILNERFYDAFLSINENLHIDTAANELNGKFVFCYPFPALQRSGFSSNNRAFCNYNGVLKPEDIYKP